MGVNPNALRRSPRNHARVSKPFCLNRANTSRNAKALNQLHEFPAIETIVTTVKVYYIDLTGDDSITEAINKAEPTYLECRWVKDGRGRQYAKIL